MIPFEASGGGRDQRPPPRVCVRAPWKARFSRPPSVSAPEEEKDVASQKATNVLNYLRGRGFPDPVVIDSGNGFHLIYRIDLPAEDGGLVKSVLAALAKRFNDPACKVDTSVSNPSRI